MKQIRTLLLLLIFLTSHAFSKIQVEIGETLDASNYPKISLKLRAFKDGQLQKLSKNQIVILEGIFPLHPDTVSDFDANGFQLLQWLSPGWWSSNPLKKRPNIYITINDETKNLTLSPSSFHPFYTDPISEIKFVDNDRNIIRELRFGNVSVGDYTNQRINVVSAKEKSRDSRKYPTRIDWVGTTSNTFKYLWLGSNINTEQPPVDIVSPFLYSIEVLFIPQENRYYRDYLIVSYDKGRQLPVALVGNSFHIPKKNQLQILQPSKNEILYPCQAYNIRWKGHKPELPVTVSYSTNKGIEWNTIDNVFGNEYLWVVPQTESDSVLLKVSQSYSNSPEIPIKTNANRPQKLSFNREGTKLLSGTMDGKITEFDFLTKSEIRSWNFANINFPIENTFISNISYCNNDSNAVISYRTRDFYDVEKNDTIVVVNLSNGSTIGLLALPQDEKVNQFIVDQSSNTLLLVKSFDNSIEIYQLPQLNFISKIPFPTPIEKIASRNNTLAVALLSNEIRILNLSTLTEVKTIKLKYLPYITNISISNDEKYIAFTAVKFNLKDIYDNFSDAYVVDISSGTIVRSLYKNWSDAISIDFSPTDNFAVIGFENNPSLLLWDIVNDVVTARINGAGYSISDCIISPSGFVVVQSETERSVIVFREFNFPETVVSEVFKIHRPKIATKEAIFPPQKIYFPSTISLGENFCNIGDVPLIIDYAYFVKGRNFSLSKNPSGDTIIPQNCGNFSIIYNPKDTGIFYDTLVIISCYQEYKIPLKGKGINRDFTFLLNKIDFGEVCVNQIQEIEIEIGTNHDSIDLPIDFVRIEPTTNKYFSVVSPSTTQVLGNLEKLKVTLRFQPRELGSFSTYLEIFYLGQKDFVFRIPLEGKGIGIELSVTPSDLRFIPEIPSRSFTITNISNTDVVIDSIVINPKNSYNIDVQTPFVLPSNTGKIINIVFQNSTIEESELRIFSSPCGVIQYITLGSYNGNSKIYFPNITTIPKGIVEIPILFQNTENSPYNGRRSFEAEVSFNPRIFLPLEIITEHGEAFTLRNEIKGDRRFFAFKIEGNFPLEGTLGKIVGNVGLAESDTSHIDWNISSKFWGKNIQVSALQGKIQLIGLCGDRRIKIVLDSLLLIQSLPNPANTSVDLFLQSNFEDILIIEVADIVGNTIKQEKFELKQGSNKITLDVKNLSYGVYRILLHSRNIFLTTSFLKI